MKRNRFYRIYSLLLLSLFFGYALQSQTNEQRTLESKRAKLQQEIKDINNLLFAEQKEKGDVLDQMAALDKKINVRQQLIRVTNQQSNLLNRHINANIRNISTLQDDLTRLKDEYAKMIQKSYQNKSQQNRVMFLLSAQNFFQAFKRLQYMKQYTQYRKEQGEEIVVKTTEIKTLNTDLADQRKHKDGLIAENKTAKGKLLKEILSQKELLGSIRQNESKYAAVIKKKRGEARKIEKRIDKLIRSAILASNKKSGVKGRDNTRFVLTPEATIVAKNFSANKGRLVWPVVRGIKKQGFGIYKDAVYPGIKHQNNGVIIATEKGTNARAIFKGEVIAILSVPGGNKGVQIKHGNYISTYYNLSKLFVSKGDKVTLKEELGTVFTNASTNETQLKFYLYKDTTRLNPEEWINSL